jgi:hypothetical protein
MHHILATPTITSHYKRRTGEVNKTQIFQRSRVVGKSSMFKKKLNKYWKNKRRKPLFFSPYIAEICTFDDF